MGLVRLAQYPVVLNGLLYRPLANVSHPTLIHTHPGDTNIVLPHGDHKAECWSPVGLVAWSAPPRGSPGA